MVCCTGKGLENLSSMDLANAVESDRQKIPDRTIKKRLFAETRFMFIPPNCCG
jgi:hypothetical protein